MQVKRNANNWLQREGFSVMRCLDKRKTEMETRPCEIFFLRMLVAVDEAFEACIWLICTRIKKNRKLDSGLVFS